MVRFINLSDRNAMPINVDIFFNNYLTSPPINKLLSDADLIFAKKQSQKFPFKDHSSRGNSCIFYFTQLLHTPHVFCTYKKKTNSP